MEKLFIILYTVATVPYIDQMLDIVATCTMIYVFLYMTLCCLVLENAKDV